MNHEYLKEPTPKCAPFYGRWATMCTDKGTIFDVAQDLERRLRHAWKLVNSLRIDVMHCDVDLEIVEQRLADIEKELE